VPILEQLSRDTGQTSYLLVRSQNSATCLARVDGQTQIRTFLLEVGDRWPLGRGAGGMAILAALDPDEAEAILVQNLDQLTQREDETALRARLAATRASGIARHANLLLQDVSGMGKAVFDRAGRPIMAISMGYVSLWMDAVQERDTRNHLVQAAGLLSRRLT
jgi:DNA-binding IclR family transcriptional regulator